MIEFARTNGFNVINLEVPAIIECRDLVLRTVSAACKLMPPAGRRGTPRSSDFSSHIVSAVGEAYNSVVLHGYAERDRGTVQMQIENCADWMRVTLRDTGASLDLLQHELPPDLDALPELDLEAFIIRSFVDEVSYVPGSPNVLTLFKRLREGDAQLNAGDPEKNEDD
jgi:anti-sigma regulatory factor (Ser/Thr protein kinase)